MTTTAEVDDLIKAALERGLQVFMEEVRRRAVNLTPIEEGTLRASAVPVSRANGTLSRHGVSVEATVRYDSVYAAPQHEGGWESGPLAGVRIRNHPKGGQSKFLETPLREMSPKLEGFLQRFVAEALRTGRVPR